MPIEIERKFLPCNSTWRQWEANRVDMRQGYLGGDACSTRVRVEGESAKLNIKSRQKGVKRLEFEYEIPLGEAMEILDRLAGDKVEKIRHVIQRQGQTFEVDEFLGANAGLVVIEVELGDENAEFPKPDWLGAEVTDEHRYYNTELARVPFSIWHDREDILKEIGSC